MRVHILSTQSGDWEGLFIDGRLIDEARTLGEGRAQLYMLEMAEKHDFKLADVTSAEIDDTDEGLLSRFGSFPESMSRLHGAY